MGFKLSKHNLKIKFKLLGYQEFGPIQKKKNKKKMVVGDASLVG